MIFALFFTYHFRLDVSPILQKLSFTFSAVTTDTSTIIFVSIYFTLLPQFNYSAIAQFSSFSFPLLAFAIEELILYNNFTVVYVFDIHLVL